MVQNALGHEKVETTAKCYVEGDPKEAAVPVVGTGLKFFCQGFTEKSEGLKTLT